MTRTLRFPTIIVTLSALFCHRMRSMQQMIGANQIQDQAQMKKMILEQRLLNNMQTTFISLVNSRTMKLENNFKDLSKKIGNMGDFDIVCPNVTSRIDNLEGVVQVLIERFAKIENDLRNITQNMKNPGNKWITFNGMKYFFSSESVQWNTAKQKCKDIDTGGNLASIRSREINNFLIRNGKNDGYWTGGNDINRERRWVWLDKGDSFGFTNWRSGEPNNAGGEDCLLLYTEPSGSRHWNDAPCNKYHRYICQSDNVPTQ